MYKLKNNIFVLKISGESITSSRTNHSLEKLKSQFGFHSQTTISKDGTAIRFCGMKLLPNYELGQNEGNSFSYHIIYFYYFKFSNIFS